MKELIDLILKNIHPYCYNAELSGALRRSVEADIIEIVAAPKVEKNSTGVFLKFEEQFTENNQLLTKCKQAKGFISFDERRIVLKYGETECKIWLCKADDYGRIQAIKTGSWEFLKYKLAIGWNRKGWCSTIDGMFKKKDCQKRGNKWHLKLGIFPELPPPFPTEQSFFKWLDVAYIHPSLRNWDMKSTDNSMLVYKYFYGYPEYFEDYIMGKYSDEDTVKDFNKKSSTTMSKELFKLIASNYKKEEFETTEEELVIIDSPDLSEIM